MGKQLPLTFEKRFDFYWKSIAIYCIVLIIYAVLRGSIEAGTLTLRISDPLVILLAIIIVFSIIGYLISIWKSPTIIIGKDYITLKTRIRELNLPVSQISKIVIGREIVTNLKRPMRIVKIYIPTRKKPFRIRPNSFWNDKELLEALIQFKKNNNK
ncbi:MAG: hypothetical protein CH6_0317 [Candidatus Kapaibacterium sp.]|jgi:hypothetical protein|nr:MAG: hypothetical protein CH6_0317 [Candidatus Kapabacteria bacterium]ROL56265.1 MAG: hypothetical protein D9V84_08825 [Bacteroidetes/Chlorobi group bacterium Naka2016]